MVYRVFLSSTSQDLVAHREAVLAAVAGLDGFAPIAMENFGARAAAAVDFDDRRVRECDVLVGLLGLCYGSNPRAGPPSFTEREYNTAIDAGVDRLMLVSPDNFQVPGHLIERDAQRRRQRKFRARVEVDLVAEASDAPFASSAALAAAVTRALANWRADRENAEEIAAELVATKTERDQLQRALAEGQKEREALRAAIMALSGKAREADAPGKIEHALDFLRRGETGEAQAIFAEILEQKQAQGVAALKEAAEAARHLGALAYLDDTEKALAAYATATRLDPDHAWPWIFLGLLHQRAGSLAQSEQAFDHAQRAASSTGHDRDQSVAQAYLGDIRLAQGSLSEALVAYEAALDVQQHLAAQDPSNSAGHRDISISFDRIGDVQRARGNLDAALQAYRDSLDIAEKLAARDPTNNAWQRDLSVSFDKFGDVRRARGDLDAALEAYRDSLAIREKLAAQDPTNSEWQRNLSVSFNKIGDMQRTRGNLDAALNASQDSLAIREKLAAQDPTNGEWQRDLSVSFNKIGDVQSARGNLDAALQAYQDSLDIAQKLAAQDPTNSDWQRVLSVSFNRIGDVQSARGNLDAALQAHQDGLGIAEKLAAQDPTNSEWQRDLIVSHWRLADLGEQRSNGGAARRHWQAALAVAKALDASGRLAPRDAHFADAIEARLSRLIRSRPEP